MRARWLGGHPHIRPHTPFRVGGEPTLALTSQQCERGGRANNATLALARYFLPPSPSALVPRVGPFGAGLFSAAPCWRSERSPLERAQDGSVHGCVRISEPSHSSFRATSDIGRP